MRNEFASEFAIDSIWMGLHLLNIIIDFNDNTQVKSLLHVFLFLFAQAVHFIEHYCPTFVKSHNSSRNKEKNMFKANKSY